MATDWKMPDELRPYEPMIADSGESVTKTMKEYNYEASALLATDPGRAIAVNAQIGLLTRLRAQGLLGDVAPCPLEQEKQKAPSWICPTCELCFTAEEALERAMICSCGGKITSTGG